MTTGKRRPGTSGLIGSSTLALATTGVGLVFTLAGGPAGAAPLPASRGTTAVQPRDATPEGGIGHDSASDATQCLPLLVPRSDDPDGPLSSPRPDTVPPVCNDPAPRGVGTVRECVPLMQPLGPFGPADLDAPNFPLSSGPPADPATACEHRGTDTP